MIESVNLLPGSPGQAGDLWDKGSTFHADPDINLEMQVRIEVTLHINHYVMKDPSWLDRLTPLMVRGDTPEPLRNDEFGPLLRILQRVFRRGHFSSLRRKQPVTDPLAWAPELWFDPRPTEYLPHILAYRVYHGPWYCPALKRAAARFIRAPWVDQGRLVMTMLNREKCPHAWAYHWALTYQLSASEMAQIPWPVASPEAWVTDDAHWPYGPALHMLRGKRTLPLLQYVAQHAGLRDPPGYEDRHLIHVLLGVNCVDAAMATVVANLEACGVDLCARDQHGNTALHAALYQWKRGYRWNPKAFDPLSLGSMISTLVAAGLDVKATNVEGKSVLDEARERRKMLVLSAVTAGQLTEVLRTHTDGYNATRVRL